MSVQLDHVIIAVQDLDTAIETYRHQGFTTVRGGTHANRATHNALITFANGTYLELLAATYEPPIPGLVDFSVLLRFGEGLVGFALRSDDLESEAARLRAHGVGVGESIPGERRRADGTLIRWKLALLEDGFAPFLIQDITPQAWRIATDPAVTTHANTARGLIGVDIVARNLSEARGRYAALLGNPAQQPEAIHLREDAHAGQPETLVALRIAYGGWADSRPDAEGGGLQASDTPAGGR